MKVVVLTTIAFEPVEMAHVEHHVAERCADADIVICVYQNAHGESQVVATVLDGKPLPDIEVFDVV